MVTSNVRVYDGLITARHGPAYGDPLLITYSAESVNAGDKVAIANHLPTRRISVGAKIVAAEPLDPCRIVVRGTDIFLHVIEGIKFREACPP